jgi:hypothetical protein
MATHGTRDGAPRPRPTVRRKSKRTKKERAKRQGTHANKYATT